MALVLGVNWEHKTTVSWFIDLDKADAAMEDLRKRHPRLDFHMVLPDDDLDRILRALQQNKQMLERLGFPDGVE